MWQTLTPVAAEVAKQLGRRKGKAAAPETPVANQLEHLGRSLELVSRLVRMDRETKGQPIVTRQDRELATDLIAVLLTDSAERKAYLEFLEIIGAGARPFPPLDPLSRNAIHSKHWAQLSSSFLAGLLLSKTAIEEVAANLLSSRPTAWEDSLPKPRGRSKASDGSSK